MKLHISQVIDDDQFYVKLEISKDVFQAVDLIADGPVQTTCIEYSKYQSAYNMNNDYKIFVSIYQNV